ncbi:stage III sporulation protein AE [Planifilum fimeticola]|jgi:stage III sporulation protein AE|uniref:Stage III sporulation protein AE n=1 Tax=Planifilum fimeticola TaxID=201975 RepID=A0A2T0LCV9_9BACL|nr:stage III sporulation protein AE [Planifilum fimeticola]PRX39804.1 stage III sporulation protein AE [Planifilum fimeticola]
MERSLKRIGLMMVIFLMAPIFCAAAENQPDSSVSDQLVRTQLEQLDTEPLESFWRDLKQEYGRYMPGGEKGNLFDAVLSPEGGFSLEGTLTALARYFFHEILYSGKLLGTVIVLTVLSMILQLLSTAFQHNQVSRVAFAVVFMVIIILAVDSFSVAVESAKTAIERMIHFMLALIPLVLTLLASMGNFGSVAMFHPLIVFMIHIVGTLIYTVIFPLLFFSAVLGIVSCLSEKYKLNQLADLFRRVSVALLGGLLTIFLGIISIQGATAAVTDGVTIRTAKYLTGNFVPVVGRMFSDAADTVVGASLLVKNAVGMAGVLILLFISAFPALKIISLAIIYNFSAAVMQPLGSGPIIDCLNIIGKTLMYIFGALATVGLMFFLAVTIIVAAGNISVMIR